MFGLSRANAYRTLTVSGRAPHLVGATIRGMTIRAATATAASIACLGVVGAIAVSSQPKVQAPAPVAAPIQTTTVIKTITRIEHVRRHPKVRQPHTPSSGSALYTPTRAPVAAVSPPPKAPVVHTKQSGAKGGGEHESEAEGDD